MDNAERVEALFHSVLSRFISIPAKHTPPAETTVAQAKALMILDLNGVQSVRRLAESLGVSSAAASELVDRLVRAGHVRRDRSEHDRRLVELSLTGKGRQLLARFTKMRMEKARRLLTVIDRGEARRLVAALETLNSILERAPR
jgi:DNA-binding MarR family transcriptional regulator